MNKTLMIYYSFGGNTDFAAGIAAASGRVDTERLIPDKEPPRSGFGKFFVGGKSAVFSESVGLKPIEHDISAYENIIIGFPVWAGTFPPAINTFIKEHPFKGKSLYAIICSSGGKHEKPAAKLRERLPDNEFKGALGLIDPLNDKEGSRKLIEKFIDNVNV